LRPGETVEAPVKIPCRRITAGVDRDRHVELLGCRPHWVVMRMAVWKAAPRERQHEPPTRAGAYRAAQLGSRRRGIAEGEMRDGNETAAGTGGGPPRPTGGGAPLGPARGR